MRIIRISMIIILQVVMYYHLSCSWTSSLEASSTVAETGQAEAYQKRRGLGKRCWEPKGKQNQRNKIQQSSFGQQSDRLCKRFWGVRVHVIYKFVSDCGGGSQAEWTGRTQVADRGACATPDDVCQLRCWVILYIDIYWRSNDQRKFGWETSELRTFKNAQNSVK